MMPITSSLVPTLPMHNQRRQRGISLVVVLLILVVVSILGVGGAQIALMAERGSRNDRDMQVAWQAAEAALVDAELDLTTPSSGGSSPARGGVFGMIFAGTPPKMVQAEKVDISNFVAACGDKTAVNGAGQSTSGLCALPALVNAKPSWLTVDFTATGNAARTVEFGTFTGRSFAAGAQGAQPVRAPRYVIEAIQDQGAASRDKTAPEVNYVYRVTGMGFGPREDIQAVLQMIYRN